MVHNYAIDFIKYAGLVMDLITLHYCWHMSNLFFLSSEDHLSGSQEFRTVQILFIVWKIGYSTLCNKFKIIYTAQSYCFKLIQNSFILLAKISECKVQEFYHILIAVFSITSLRSFSTYNLAKRLWKQTYLSTQECVSQENTKICYNFNCKYIRDITTAIKILGISKLIKWSCLKFIRPLLIKKKPTYII